VTPLKPLTTPVKEFVVMPVYVIISSSIFASPHSAGNPLVLFTKITSASAETSAVSSYSPYTSEELRLFKSRYWSKFEAKSIAPPWNSWET